MVQKLICILAQCWPRKKFEEGADALMHQVAILELARSKLVVASLEPPSYKLNFCQGTLPIFGQNKIAK